MNLFSKILNYIIPIIAGLVILIFAILGYSKAKSNGTERKNIGGAVLGVVMILVSIFLMLLE